MRRALLLIVTFAVAVQLLAGCFGVGVRDDGGPKYDPQTGERMPTTPTTPAEDAGKGAAIGGAIGGPEGAALGILIATFAGIIIRRLEKKRDRKKHQAVVDQITGKHPTVEG